MTKKKKGKKAFLITEIILISISLCAILLLGLSLLSLMHNDRTELPVLENKIKEVQELVTVKQIYRDVIYTKVGTIINSQILFSIDYNIVAGTNLSKGLTLEPQEDGTITVTLPEPEILSIDADDQSIDQIYIKENLRRVRQSDYMGLIIKEKEDLTRTAIESGILTRAKLNSETIIQRILHLSGYEHVRFQYKKPSRKEEENEA